MSRKCRHLLSLILGVVILVLLVMLTRGASISTDSVVAWVLYVVLVTFTMTVGVPLGGGEVSLQPMAIVSAALVLGPVPAAWAAYIGALIRGLVRQRWAVQLGARVEPEPRSSMAVSTANATMHSVSILVAGEVYAQLGGVWPVETVGAHSGAVVALAAGYLVLNFSLAGLYIRFLEQASLAVYLRSLPRVVAFEAPPLLLSPLISLIYVDLGVAQFVLTGLALVVVSLGGRGLALSRERLERRVRELDSLRAVGEALSTSLEMDAVLEAIYEQVSHLMPARNFYIALRDPTSDRIRFPLAVEDGQRVQWQPRRPRNGTTEHILRQGTALLMARDVAQHLQELGLEAIGPPAASWLGVPIAVRGTTVGVIGLQSRDTAGVYDGEHQRILSAIAAQAAAAIQRARLYQRTDEILERRVQELDSVLRTTQEGILLLDNEWRVVTTNPALVRLLGLGARDLRGKVLGIGEDGLALLERLGYSAGELHRAAERLAAGKGACREAMVLEEPGLRHLERTMVPVRDRDQAIAGWLFLLRDTTEEAELNQFRDDMARMLVHDLRSPLAVLRGSLDLIADDLARADLDGVERWVAAAQSGSDRMLRLIDQLLDLSRLESGRLPTSPEPVDASLLLEETVQRLASLAREAEIRLQIVTEPGLPPLWVDRGLIARVLGNLVDNALKFTDNGGVVRVWASSDSAGSGQTVLVGVSDTGRGIDAAAQEALFEKFSQADGTEGRRRGTGLGLAFCRLAVETLEGEIWVESPSDAIDTAGRGRGTTFAMRLPAARERAG